MNKLNRKGFTLIELLAVITIMGILMVVAIPSVSRTIENTRRDSFLDTAKQYVNGVKTMFISDSIECPESAAGAAAGTYVLGTSLKNGTYYIRIDTTQTSTTGSGTEYPIILESGGKSSWSSKDVKGYVRVVVSGSGTGTLKQTYYVALSDNLHGIKESATPIEYLKLKRGNVAVSGVAYTDVAIPASALVCKEV